jgi:hypothetical protein
MAVVKLINRRRRRNPESRTARSRAAKKGWRHRRAHRSRRRNPWFGDSAGHARAARKGWRHRRRSHAAHSRRSHRRHYRRNPRGLTVKGFINNTLMPGSVGAFGALGLDIALGFIPLPATLQTGMFRPVVRLAGAAALGMIAGKVVDARVGEQVAAGATIVVLYDLFKGFAKTALPNLPLSGMEYYSAGMPVGEYFPGGSTGAAHASPKALSQASQAPSGGIVQPMRELGEYIF